LLVTTQPAQQGVVDVTRVNALGMAHVLTSKTAMQLVVLVAIVECNISLCYHKDNLTYKFIAECTQEFSLLSLFIAV